MHLLGGDDHFDARGTGGAGLHFTGPTVITGGEGNDDLLRGESVVDSIDGGPGDDVLDAQPGNDVLNGGPGDDVMTGGGDDDTLTGGPGHDTFNGNDGNDTFHAQDDEADISLSGGPGTDTANIDTGIDPAPVAVENVIGDGGPPPGGPGCSYNAVTSAVSATMTAGAQATLVVVGDEIRFGDPAVACGAATTANTDTITVGGVAGSVETLVIDQSGGAFAPGATAETGTSEIEISTLLGDASDLVIVNARRPRLHLGRHDGRGAQRRRRHRRHLLAAPRPDRGLRPRRARTRSTGAVARARAPPTPERSCSMPVTRATPSPAARATTSSTEGSAPTP